jgi:hypothetical protein
MNKYGHSLRSSSFLVGLGFLVVIAGSGDETTNQSASVNGKAASDLDLDLTKRKLTRSTRNDTQNDWPHHRARLT